MRTEVFVNLLCLALYVFIEPVKTERPAMDEITSYFRDFAINYKTLWLMFDFQHSTWILRKYMHVGDFTAVGG